MPSMHTRKRHKKTTQSKVANRVRSTRPGELIHTDLMGPITPTSTGGARYSAQYVDDASRFVWAKPMKTKCEQMPYLRSLEKHLGRRRKSIHTIRSDRGGEYVSGEANKWSDETGIRLETTHANWSFENGVAERTNRTLMDVTRTMIIAASVPKEWWGEAINTATYVRNRSWHAAIDSTPYEKFYGTKPDISRLKTFGCLVYFSPATLQEGRKIEVRKKKGILMGYSDNNTLGYRIVDMDIMQIITSADTTFVEDNLPFRRHR